jgi:hypothetical protein
MVVLSWASRWECENRSACVIVSIKRYDGGTAKERKRREGVMVRKKVAVGILSREFAQLSNKHKQHQN